MLPYSKKHRKRPYIQNQPQFLETLHQPYLICSLTTTLYSNNSQYMFPTTTKNPFPYSIETTTTQLKKPFPWDDNNNHHHHQNPSYAQEVEPPFYPSYAQEVEPPFFLHFPSPFLDNQEMPLSQIFSQETVPVKNNSCPTTKTKGSAKEANKKKKNIIIGSTSRRRTGKKDRHSKICTAQGVRDRRMRLSLQIARKFFDLQDMLGFDKASSTIDWLLSQSKTAINELTSSAAPPKNNNGSSSSTTESFMSAECELAMSSMDIDEENLKDNNLKKKKESREKARARARERTKEKMMRIKTNNPFLDQENRTTTSHDEEQQLGVGITEKYLGAASSTVASIFQYHDDPIDPNSNSFMGFVGNYWELAPLISGNPSGSSSLYLGATTLDLQLLDQQNNFSSSCNQ